MGKFKADLATGRGIGAAVEAKTGQKVPKEGSHLFVKNPESGEHLYWADTGRTLPKPVRESVIAKLLKWGFLAVLVIAGLIHFL